MPRYRPPTEKQIQTLVDRLLQGKQKGDKETLKQLKYNHPKMGPLGLDEISAATFKLSDARRVIASINGYANWRQMNSHLKRLRQGSELSQLKTKRNRSEQGLVDDFHFEQACQAIVDGDLKLLTRLLSASPSLTQTRSRRAHQCTLLHYLAANGIEQHRQKTPKNAVEIMHRLLDHGAEADALAQTYGGGEHQTTLSLLVSSGWPHQVGLQADLIRVLCRGGANPNGRSEQGIPLVTALLFFYPEAARTLAACGAKTSHLIAACAVGNVKDVDACFTSTGRLRSGNFTYLGFQIGRPAKRVPLLGQALTYAALCGNLATMKRLVGEHRCPVDAPADRGIRAIHSAAFAGQQKIVNWLIKQGAKVCLKDLQWNSTPSGWARAGGHDALAKKLAKLEAKTN